MWVIRKSSLCPQGQIFTCFCLTYSSHFPSSKMGRGRECLSLSSGALPFICASGNRSHCFPPLLPLWLLCEFGFLFLKWCLSLNSGKTWKEKKKKTEEIRSGQMGADAVKINDRNDQLSLLQDDSWTTSDKGSQACTTEPPVVQRKIPILAAFTSCLLSSPMVCECWDLPFLYRDHGGRELSCFKSQNY